MDTIFRDISNPINTTALCACNPSIYDLGHVLSPRPDMVGELSVIKQANAKGRQGHFVL